MRLNLIRLLALVIFGLCFTSSADAGFRSRRAAASASSCGSSATVSASSCGASAAMTASACGSAAVQAQYSATGCSSSVPFGVTYSVSQPTFAAAPVIPTFRVGDLVMFQAGGYLKYGFVSGFADGAVIVQEAGTTTEAVSPSALILVQPAQPTVPRK